MSGESSSSLGTGPPGSARGSESRSVQRIKSVITLRAGSETVKEPFDTLLVP
jgi:hypothetical protein